MQVFAILTVAFLTFAPVQDKTGELEKKEKDAWAAVTSETARLARFCASEKAYADARIVLMQGLDLAPDAKLLEDELKKVPDQGGSTSKSYSSRYVAERRKADEKRGLALAEFAAKASAAGQSEKFQETLWTIQKHFPSKKAFEKAGAFLFEPYLQWVSKADLAKLQGGMEFIDGKWLAKKDVAALNETHSSWRDPWILSDEVHEVRSTLPYRDVRRVINYAGTFRRFELQKFEGLWDLQPPKGKLPIILTWNQADLRTHMERHYPDRKFSEKDFNGAAYYLHTTGSLDPCLVTLEPMDVSGGYMKITLEGALHALRHELTHQICFEYSKHAADDSRLGRYQSWCVEGIANYMEYYVFEQGDWRLSRPKVVDLGGTKVEGDFAWAAGHARQLPPIARFIEMDRSEFYARYENYPISATLSWFLFDGEGGKYRGSFMKLLEGVHKIHDRQDTFDQAFLGFDAKTMQAEFLKFVERIQLE